MSRPAAIASDLFSLRAQSLLTGLGPVVARSRLSGLLIGIELAAARPYWLGQDVAIVASDSPGDAYAEALEDLSIVRVAVNQEIAEFDSPVAPGDEVALFPPMTGG